MYPGNPDPLLIAVMGTFLFSGKSALFSSKLLHCAFQISGIRYGISITVRIECFDSDINSNRSSLIGTWFRFKFNIQHRKIFSGRRIFNGYVMDFSHFHRLTHFNISEFRKFDISSHNTNIVFLIYRSVGLKPVMFAFEGWIGSSFLKEIHKSPVKIPQRLLQCNGICFFQKSKLFPLFQFCQHGRCLAIADFFSFFIAFLTHGKSPVVDEPAASQRLVNKGFLFFIRVDSEFDPFLHYPILSFCLRDVFWFPIYRFTASSSIGIGYHIFLFHTTTILSISITCVNSMDAYIPIAEARGFTTHWIKSVVSFY